MIKFMSDPKVVEHLEPCTWYWLGGPLGLKKAQDVRKYVLKMLPSYVVEASRHIGGNAIVCATTLVPVLDRLQYHALAKSVVSSMSGAVCAELKARRWYNFWRKQKLLTAAKVHTIYFRKMLAQAVITCAPHIGEVKYSVVYANVSELRHFGLTPPKWVYHARD